jgi:hypothetical protein
MIARWFEGRAYCARPGCERSLGKLDHVGMFGISNRWARADDGVYRAGNHNRNNPKRRSRDDGHGSNFTPFHGGARRATWFLTGTHSMLPITMDCDRCGSRNEVHAP